MKSSTSPHRLFLLSPASISGKRASFVMREAATFDLAVRLRKKGAPLGELFSFMSGLYFRGKLSYANAFAAPPSGLTGVWVITTKGLLPAEHLMSLEMLKALGESEIDVRDERYMHALSRDAQRLAEESGPQCRIVLLGSVATPKYVEPLSSVFGDRLFFPKHFIGRGDLSRGGLLLRSVQTKEELEYIQVGTLTHHGARPPKLARL